MASLRARGFNAALKITIRSVWQSNVSVARVRRRMAHLDALFPKVPRGSRISHLDASGVPVDCISTGESRSGRVLVYIHGGGFSLHTPRLYANFAAGLGRRLRARVLLVNYRLAPEHPFPAAPKDCLTAYRWLLQQPGITPDQIVLAGDSAGGNLVLVTLLMAKEAGLPMPAAAWAISPGVDCEWSHSGIEEKQAFDPMFNAQALDLMNPYFGTANRQDFRISPLNGSLSGLPPLLLDAGGREIFSEHPAMFAQRARAAGVEIQDRVWDGMSHVFPLFSFLPEARLARKQACHFLRSHMNAGANAPRPARADTLWATDLSNAEKLE
jgi:monoterpene epsilon-lactone hydrolase